MINATQTANCCHTVSFLVITSEIECLANNKVQLGGRKKKEGRKRKMIKMTDRQTDNDRLMHSVNIDHSFLLSFLSANVKNTL